ncbi:hypothetical protein B7463_g5557, partial [Scytalidium lignicola]
MFEKGYLKGKRLDWAITAASCQAFLLLGYDQGVTSGIIGADNQFGHDFNSPDSKLQGTIVSIYDIRCAVGALFCFVFGERFGRKRVILAGGTTMIIGTIILASSQSLAQLLVGRIVTGIGNGFNSSTVPMYQSEMARGTNRGMLLSMQGVVTIVGVCIAYWLDYGMSFVNGPSQWRFPMAFQGFFAILLVLQMLPLPETPRYLIENNRNSEASEVLARLQGGDATVDHPEVVFQRQQIEVSIEIESVGGPFRYQELLQGGKLQNFRRLVLCCAVNLMQQFTGANMINYYAPVFLGIGWLPIPWFYPAEISTTRIRSRGQAIGSFINWMCVFTVVQITPIAISNISWHTFIIFAVFNAFWVPIVYCFFPETNQLELEDIDHLFEKGGITGGVFKSRGKTVERNYHTTHPKLEGIEKNIDMEMQLE